MTHVIKHPGRWVSGNSVVIQWQSSVPEIWTPVYNGMPLEKELLVSSVLPMVFHCVPIIQINIGLPLGHHWVLASASEVSVAS